MDIKESILTSTSDHVLIDSIHDIPDLSNNHSKLNNVKHSNGVEVGTYSPNMSSSVNFDCKDNQSYTYYLSPTSKGFCSDDGDFNDNLKNLGNKEVFSEISKNEEVILSNVRTDMNSIDTVCLNFNQFCDVQSTNNCSPTYDNLSKTKSIKHGNACNNGFLSTKVSNNLALSPTNYYSNSSSLRFIRSPVGSRLWNTIDSFGNETNSHSRTVFGTTIQEEEIENEDNLESERKNVIVNGKIKEQVSDIPIHLGPRLAAAVAQVSDETGTSAAELVAGLAEVRRRPFEARNRLRRLGLFQDPSNANGSSTNRLSLPSSINLPPHLWNRATRFLEEPMTRRERRCSLVSLNDCIYGIDFKNVIY